MKLRKHWCLLYVAVALVAVVMRLAPLLRSDLSFSYRPDDSYEYLQLAVRMRDGCGFARMIDRACQPAEILRTPGYPLFLMMLPHVGRVLAAQALCRGLLCLLVAGWIAGWWKYSAALAAECLIAFDVPSIVMSSEVMSETLFQLLLVLALVPPLLTIEWPGKAGGIAVVAGVVAGCAILVRPIGVLLPIILPIPLILNPRLNIRARTINAIAAFALPAVFLVGWSGRNYEIAHYPGLSTVGAINMYYYRAADVMARRQGILLINERQAFGAKLGVRYDDIYRAGVQSEALAQRMNRLGLEILAHHPIQTAAMTAQAAVYLALAPIRSPLARMLGTSGESMGGGLNAGAPSLRRVRTVMRTILTSPLLTALVILEVMLTLILCGGIAIAIGRCWCASLEYRLWTLYPAFAGIAVLCLAAGGEADARFRAPVIPLAIGAALG